MKRFTFSILVFAAILAIGIYLRPSQVESVVATSEQRVLPKQEPKVFPKDQALPAAQDVHWNQPAPEPELAEFQRWAQTYAELPVTEKTAAEAEGVRLASQRRVAMKMLIQRDPERALQRAISESSRRAMPPAVAQLLERRVDERGDLFVDAAGAGISPLPKGANVITRTAVVGGEELQAYVYGHRSTQPSRENIPLHGIAIDGELALSEWPGRVLEPIERNKAKSKLPKVPVCPASKLPTSSGGDETAIMVGKSVEFFCGKEHAADTLVAAATEEILRPPGLGERHQSVVDAASGGNGVTAPIPQATADAAWTTGNKTIGIVRVKFDGSSYQAFTVEDCEQVITNIGDRFRDWSYGRLNVRGVGPSGSFVTPVLDLPHGASYYDADKEDGQDDDNVSTIWQLAKNWAFTNGRGSDSYDFLVVVAGDAPIRDDEGKVVWWGGVARIGAKISLLRMSSISDTVDVGMHELGHNLGLYHSSNLWTTPQLQVPDSGFPFFKYGAEYGDRYCRMGSGNLAFNARYKHWLHWLDDENFPVAIADGRFTIREHDLEEKTGLRGLQVPFSLLNSIQGTENFLSIEYRLAGSTSTWLTYGAQIRQQVPNSPKAYLLDATPETPNHEPGEELAGNFDSPLMPGRTLSVTKYGQTVHITNIDADPESGKLVVQVNHGTPVGNAAPTGNIQFWTPTGGVDQEVYFTAAASDADGDELAYHWDIPFGGVSVHQNSPTVSAKFSGIGTKAITCIVSDMHGGVTTLTASFVVANNQPPTISAITDKFMDEDTVLSNIPFVVADATSDPSSLVVTATSDNTSLFPAGSLVVSSAGGGNRGLSLTPVQNRHGVANITVQVSDGGLTAIEQFQVTVQGITPGITIFASGAAWRYWDAAASPPSGWQTSGFLDSSWNAGSTRFVYNQSALLPSGSTGLAAPFQSRNTCYFRKTFTMPATLTGTATLRLLCDDGAIVYLNGTEIARLNMPAGSVTSQTKALASVEGGDEKVWNIFPVDTLPLILGGVNTIAVEVHDVGFLARSPLSNGSGDVTFDCEFGIFQAPTVSAISNKISQEDTLAGPYTFNASDSESPGGNLVITAESSDQSLVRDEDIKFGFNLLTFQRSVSLMPRRNATGIAQITVKVSDGASAVVEKFTLTITPVNDAPTIKPLSPVTVAFGDVPPLIELNVADLESAPESLVVTASSTSPIFLGASAFEVLPGPTPSQRWLRITPTPGLSTHAVVTVTVSDGTASSATSLTFRVSNKLALTSTDLALVRSRETWLYSVQPLPINPRNGQPVDFTTLEFDDRGWGRGPSQLGYGDTDQITSIPSTPYRVTTYFRRSFTIADPALFSALKWRLLRDDGAVVYLNGTVVLSSNMPSTVTPSTLASTDVTGTAEDAWINSTTSASALQPGLNVIAVEVHQSVLPNLFSQGDLSFDLELDGVMVNPSTGADVLVPMGGPWHYWDAANYPDDTWRGAAFAADDWKVGLGRLGYGVGGEMTAVNDLNAAGNSRNPSVLFRKVFDVADPKAYASLHLIVQRDDGLAVYLNGDRVLSDNVAVTCLPGDFALEEIPSADRLLWHHYTIDRTKLLAGRNLLAVEVHQASAADVDLAFDLQLTGVLTDAPPTLFLRPVGGQMELSWSAAYENWALRESSALTTWATPPATSPRLIDGGWIYVYRPMTSGKQFFRLEKQ